MLFNFFCSKFLQNNKNQYLYAICITNVGNNIISRYKYI